MDNKEDNKLLDSSKRHSLPDMPVFVVANLMSNNGRHFFNIHVVHQIVSNYNPSCFSQSGQKGIFLFCLAAHVLFKKAAAPKAALFQDFIERIWQVPLYNWSVLVEDRKNNNRKQRSKNDAEEDHAASGGQPPVLGKHIPNPEQ